MKLRNFRKRKPFVLSILISILNIIISQPLSAAGWSSEATVNQIKIDVHSVLTELDPTAFSTDINTCGSAWFAIYNGTTTMDDFQKAMYSAALSSKTSNRLFKIYSSTCTGSNNTLEVIQIVP